jgi:hypothetical protein
MAGSADATDDGRVTLEIADSGKKGKRHLGALTILTRPETEYH